MLNSTTLIVIIVVAVVLIVAIVLGLVAARRRRINLRDTRQVTEQPKSGGYTATSGFDLAAGGEHPVADRTEVDGQPAVGDDAAVPRDSAQRGVVDVDLPGGGTASPTAPTAEPEPAAEPEAPAAESPTSPATETSTETPTETSTEAPTDAPATGTPAAEAPVEPTGTEPTGTEPAAPAEPVIPEVPATAEKAAEPVPTEEIAPTQGRLERLRGRLSRSQSTFGKGLLGLLGAGDLDEDSWTDIEDTLLMADLGSATTMEIVEKLRTELSTRAVRTADDARAALRAVLVDALGTGMERSVRALPHAGGPGVVLIAGVNGTGKTTTTGKLARVLVAQGRTVLLGAADTFRAAAADQLETWGNRVGAETVRGKEGADPAAVAFDAVKRGGESGVDTVLIDTAGRLHTKTGLMDELGKVKRVVGKQASVDEVLLVLDATTGQNGLAQARVFAEVVDITGIVLTKLDGTAKGGIVFQVQRELGVPVKLVGLGEGADDLAPFEPAAFVDALLAA